MRANSPSACSGCGCSGVSVEARLFHQLDPAPLGLRRRELQPDAGFSSAGRADTVANRRRSLLNGTLQSELHSSGQVGQCIRQGFCLRRSQFKQGSSQANHVPASLWPIDGLTRIGTSDASASRVSLFSPNSAFSRYALAFGVSNASWLQDRYFAV